MTYTDPDIDDQQTDGDDEGNDLRNLRNKAKRADKLEKENAELMERARRGAFLEAGVDVKSPIGALFMRAYDGELEEEAIKAAYAELGQAPSSDDDGGEEPPDPDVEGTRQRQALATGAASDDGEMPVTPVRGRDGRAVKAGKEALERGVPRDDAAGIAFGELVGAAAEGDRSVIIPFGGVEQP